LLAGMFRRFDCKSLAVRDNASVLVRRTRIAAPTTPSTRPATRGRISNGQSLVAGV